MSLLERVVVTYWKVPGGGLAAPGVMLVTMLVSKFLKNTWIRNVGKHIRNSWGQLPIYTLEYRKEL